MIETYKVAGLRGPRRQRLVEHVHGDVPQAREGVLAARTPRTGHDLIKSGLADSVVDLSGRDGGAGLHERRAEETVGVAVVVEHVHRDGYRAGALTPASKSEMRIRNDAYDI